MGHKVLFDGNGSGIIQVVGLGLFVPAEKHNEVMQKWEQAQAERDALAKEVDAANDRNAELIEERDALAAQVEALRSAYQNLCGAIDDMDNCEEGTAEMETAIGEMFHAMRNGYNKVHATPLQCLRDVIAAAIMRFAAQNFIDYKIASEYADKMWQGGE
ncbi:MAG TPA: hypothetical protein DCS87_11835 [Rheinheimera sp.]|nr:hypothetical protein [Rheinheimera sp.]